MKITIFSEILNKSWMDFILGAFLLFGLFIGLKNGLFVELASIVSFFIGLFIAFKFSYLMRAILEGHVSWDPNTIQICAFIITLLLVVIGIHLLAKIFTKIADFAFLGWLNRLAGGFVALLKSIILLGILLVLIGKINVDNAIISKEKQEASLFYQPIVKTTNWLLPFLADWLEEVKEEVKK
jgi:membrane protein required for colicin V production